MVLRLRPPFVLGSTGLAEHDNFSYYPNCAFRRLPVTKVRALDGSEKTPELLQELFQEGTKELIDCLPGVWDSSVG